MTSWWLSAAASVLRKQVDGLWPHRDHASDGTIGDTAHQATKSDHNPAPPSMVVRAIDIDRDLVPTDKKAMDRLAEALRLCAKTDKRISYIIYANRISSKNPFYLPRWKWRPYKGADPHTSHLHISFTTSGDHDPRPFQLGGLK